MFLSPFTHHEKEPGSSMASSKLRIHVSHSGVLFTLLMGLFAGCKSSSTDKVDAGQRKYCLAPDASADRGSGNGADALSTTDVGDSGLELVVDMAGAPDARLGDTVAEVGNVKGDGGLDDASSGRTDSSGDMGGTDGSGADGGGDTGGSGGTSGNVGTGGSGGTGGGGGTIGTGGAIGPDASADTRLDANNDAKDGPAGDTAAAPDLGTGDASGLADVIGDSGVPDGPADVPSPSLDAPPAADSPQVDAAVPPADTASPPPADAAPAVCGVAGCDWAKAWAGTNTSPDALPANSAPATIEGIATAADGTLWAAGNFGEYVGGALDFGTGSPILYSDPQTDLGKEGSPDVFLAKLDPSTGLATAAFDFGDTHSNDQHANGVAVAANGNVGIIGDFSGEIDFTAKTSKKSTGGVRGFDYLTNSGSIEFWGVFSGASTGTYVTPIFENTADVGTGSLLSIASNPGQSVFAICGDTSKLVDDGDTVDGGLLTDASATYGGGKDIVVSKIDGSTGSVVWGKQFGGAGDQVCQSVAIDNNGDVVVAGNYNGTLDFGLGALPTTGSSNALIYVAKLNGSTGAAIVAHGWGTSGRSDEVGLAVDASNNIVVAGSMAGNIDFGNNAGGTDVSITNAGLTDAYAVKLTSALVPVWAKSFGDSAYDQNAKTVAVSSGGDVFIAGLFEGTLNGLGLTATSNTAPDAFIAQLASVNGSLRCAAQSYGDAAGAQGIGSLAVARAAAGALSDAVFIGGSFASSITLGSYTFSTSGPGSFGPFLARLAPP